MTEFIAEFELENRKELEASFEMESHSEIEATFQLNVTKDGKDGKDATINGYNVAEIVPGTGIDVQTEDGTITISNTSTTAAFSDITGSPYDNESLAQALNDKQDVIDDLSEIRAGAALGATAAQPSDIGNATLTIQKNGSAVGTFTANAKQDDTINITVPTQPSDIGAATAAQGALADSALQPSDVVNNTTSTASDAPLSANMGKSLQDQVNNLNGRGRYLALWNCSTGLAQSNPPQSTYTYKAGDYFIVGTVASAGGTNYRPSGSSYTTGVASTVVETEDVAVNDVYYYDGTSWSLQINTQKEIAFVNIAGDPYDNSNLAGALNDKQDEITAQNKLSSDLVDDTNNTNKFVTTQEKTTWNGKQDALPTQTGQSGKFLTTDGSSLGWGTVDLSGKVPYTGATGAVDLNAQDLKNVDNLAVGTSTVDSNEKILSVGQNRIVTNNNNGLFISSTTSQTRKGMYGVPMALEIQFNSNNQAYSYPLGFHDMNSNNNGGQFLFTSFSSNIGAATAGDVMVENDKGGLIFNTGNSKTGSKMRFTVGNWQATPQLTLTANGVGVKTLNPNSSYAMDVNGTLNATNILINGQPIDVGGDANVQYTSGGGGTEYVDLSTLYVDSQGATYGFSYDSMSSTIKNDNVQVDESFAYGYIELYLANDGDITISFNQDSEQNYDFGEISELDEYLNQDNYEDTDYVAWSGKDYGSISDSITFSNVTAGYHFFTIKYIKDSSSESGTDTFEITGIEISGGGAGSLIDTDTQQEIPLSQINDMPQVLQDIRDSIPDPVDPSDFVTLSTTQKIQAAKAIFGTDVAFGSDTTQKNLLAVISNSNSVAGNWIGRLAVGAKNKTFIMGTYGGICVLGAHSWTNAQQGTGAAWEPVYINPDGDKAVYIGGSPINGKQALMVIQNVNANTTGTVKINRSSNLTNNFKDVACWGDNISKFNNDAGYTTNVGTVTSVNNVSPVNGNVTLSIPTVNNPTITITQGGVTKGSFTLNQASGDTIALDAGGGGSGADTDLSNLTTTGKKNAYKAVIPSASNALTNIVDSAVSTLSRSYTAPAEGYFYAECNKYNGAITFYKNNANMGWGGTAHTSEGDYFSVMIPCKTGDVVSYSTSAGYGSIWYSAFYYAEGTI